MFTSDYSLRNVVLAASFTFLSFGAAGTVQDLAVDGVDVKESDSKNWKEFNCSSSMVNSSYSNAKIINVFDIHAEKEDFIFELDSFFASIEDGSIFDDVSAEVWALAEQVVEKNPKIINYI